MVLYAMISLLEQQFQVNLLGQETVIHNIELVLFNCCVFCYLVTILPCVSNRASVLLDKNSYVSVLSTQFTVTFRCKTRERELGLLEDPGQWPPFPFLSPPFSGAASVSLSAAPACPSSMSFPATQWPCPEMMGPESFSAPLRLSFDQLRRHQQKLLGLSLAWL